MRMQNDRFSRTILNYYGYKVIINNTLHRFYFNNINSDILYERKKKSEQECPDFLLKLYGIDHYR